MTFSIVARCEETGNLGVAVQSAWFAVGHIVPWVNAGVGVVATQSLAEPSYGTKGLSLMRAGLDANRTLESLLEIDPESEVRQVAMIDARGNVAVHTGSRCIAEAEHAVRGSVACQGNILRAPGIPDRMLDAYYADEGDLAHRMVAALLAADAAGGDLRGRQSAALMVVAAEGKRDLYADRLYDVRVDDHADPIGELARVVRAQRSSRQLSIGEELLVSGHIHEAVEHLSLAYELAPADTNAILLATAGYLAVGAREKALEIVATTRALPSVDWPRLARSYAEADAYPNVDIDEYEGMFLRHRHAA